MKFFINKGGLFIQKLKKEIHGSRNKWLDKLLDNNGIEFIENIWFVSSKWTFNNNNRTRFAIFLEDEISFDITKFLSFVNKNVPVYNVFVDEDKKEIQNTNLRNNKTKTFTYENFRAFLIEKLGSEFVDESAKGSEDSSSFSRFFRENMGNGVVMTDLDYYLPSKNLLIEEKTFTNSDNNICLGIGPCISIKKELLPYVLSNLKYIFLAKDQGNYFYANTNNLDCNNRQVVKGYGKSVIIPSCKIEKEKLINNLKTNI